MILLLFKEIVKIIFKVKVVLFQLLSQILIHLNYVQKIKNFLKIIFFLISLYIIFFLYNFF